MFNSFYLMFFQHCSNMSAALFSNYPDCMTSIARIDLSTSVECIELIKALFFCNRDTYKPDRNKYFAKCRKYDMTTKCGNFNLFVYDFNLKYNTGYHIQDYSLNYYYIDLTNKKKD